MHACRAGPTSPPGTTRCPTSIALLQSPPAPPLLTPLLSPLTSAAVAVVEPRRCRRTTVAVDARHSHTPHAIHIAHSNRVVRHRSASHRNASHRIKDAAKKPPTPNKMRRCRKGRSRGRCPGGARRLFSLLTHFRCVSASTYEASKRSSSREQDRRAGRAPATAQRAPERWPCRTQLRPSAHGPSSRLSSPAARQAKGLKVK